MKPTLLVICALLINICTSAQAKNIVYRFEKTNDETYACFKYTASGGLLNGGNAVADSDCGKVVYRFEKTNDDVGSFSCFKYTPGGGILNGGYSVAESYCE